MTFLAEWACETFGWTLDYVLDGIPASAVMLLRRQWIKRHELSEDFDLSEIEEIDEWQTATSN